MTELRECKKHGLTTFAFHNDKTHDGRWRCRLCQKVYSRDNLVRTKQILVEIAGGCCQSCGYDTCLAALEFHHKNPAEKEFQISGIKGGPRTYSLGKLIKEVQKCILVCANCHREIEAGLREVPNNPD